LAFWARADLLELPFFVAAYKTHLFVAQLDDHDRRGLVIGRLTDHQKWLFMADKMSDRSDRGESAISDDKLLVPYLMNVF
jgi:hypothetical protein